MAGFGERLVAEFYGPVQGYVRLRVPERDCEDVIAEVFLRAVERQDERRGDFGAWLFAIARSRVAQYYREREVEMRAAAETRKEAARGERAARAGNTPLERLEHAEFRERLRRKLAALSVLERDAIAFKFTDGLSNVQIARILGISPNRLGVTLHRALGRLRTAMLKEA